MLLDEVAAGLDFVAHEDAEHVVGGAGVLHGHFDKGAVGRVERGFAQLFGVHFAQAFEPRDGQSLLPHLADRVRQTAQIFQPDVVLAATQDISRLIAAGPLLGNAHVEIEGYVDSMLLERERVLQQQINIKAEGLTRLLNGHPKEEEAEAAKKELDSLLFEYQETEALIREALEILMEGRTTLIIAQRVSTVQNADQIIVLDRGSIAGIGTHEEMLETSRV